MKNICKYDICTGCGACANVCPKKCIKLTYTNDGFLYPIISDGCINCGNCRMVCPAVSSVKCNNIISAFTAHSTDETVLTDSTSGGMFTEIAKAVIDMGGVVFGAAFNSTFDYVLHSSTDNIEGIKQFRGSKYIQSETRNTFREAKELLDSDKYVLYTGAPCQISGLLSYLKQDYPNLVTMDFICHGVASTKMFHEYIRSLNIDRKSIVRIKFRDKTNGYRNGFLTLTLTLRDGSNYSNDTYKSSFGLAFANNIINRVSCANCKYATSKRVADITVADYIGNDVDEYEEKNGSSVLLINTPNGNDIFKRIASSIVIKEQSISRIIESSQHLRFPAQTHKNRRRVFKEIDKEGYEYIMQRYFCKFKAKPSMKNLLYKIILLIKV